MRIVGIVGLFVICSTIGVYFGQMGKKKILFFLEFKRVLTLLKGEIRYGITPIGDACNHVAGKTEGKLKEFLYAVGYDTKKKEKESFTMIWQDAAQAYLPKSYFEPGEWKQIMTIGSGIGYLDVAMQLKTFDLLLEQVERSLDNARLKQEKDGKLYQTLGVGIGLMLAIVLI